MRTQNLCSIALEMSGSRALVLSSIFIGVNGCRSLGGKLGDIIRKYTCHNVAKGLLP